MNNRFRTRFSSINKQVVNLNQMECISKTTICVVLVLFIYGCNSKNTKTQTKDSLKKDTLKEHNKNAQGASINSNPPDLNQENIYTNLRKIVFPAFNLEINDLQVVFGINGMAMGDSTNQKFIFHNNKKHLTINEKADTLDLFMSDEVGHSDLDNAIDHKLIKIIPTEKDDQFKVSYCYQYIIENEKGGAVYITDTTACKPVKDSANLFFRMPLFRVPINEIKTRLNVTDSITRVSEGEYGEEKYIAYIVKDKKLVLTSYDIWIKIDRFRSNGLQETKIIRLWQFEEE